MRFTIVIDSENEGCRTRDDVLELAAGAVKRARLAGTDTKHAIRDVNGNRVGYYQISAEDTDEEDEEN